MLRFASLFAMLLISSATAATTDRSVDWAGVTQVDHCDNWNCVGVTGVPGVMEVPLLPGESSADIEVASLLGMNLKLRVTTPGGSVSTAETTSSTTVTVTFTAATGGELVKVLVYDPIIEHQAGTGTSNPLPFTVSMTIHT